MFDCDEVAAEMHISLVRYEQEILISLSLLKIGKQHLKFLVLLSKMEKLFSLSFSLLEA